MRAEDRRRTLTAVGAVALTTLASTAWADDAPYLQVEGGASFLSQWANGEVSPSTASYGLGAGYHWKALELGIAAEHNYWLTGINSGSAFPDSVLNLALDAGFLSFSGRARHGAAIGTSTMLFDTEIDSRGHTGLYIEAKPVGLRFPLRHGWRLEVEPLNIAIMAPVLDGIPLFQLAYRTTVGIGWEI